MTTPAELTALAERVKAASGPARALDAAIASIVRLERVPDWARNWSGEWRPNELGSVVMMHADGTPGPHFMAREYTASLDAAMTLVPEGAGITISRYWVGWSEAPVWSAEIATGGVPDQPRQVFDCYDAPNPAIAVAASSLLARASLTR